MITQKEILVEARQLCKDEGKTWSKLPHPSIEEYKRRADKILQARAKVHEAPIYTVPRPLSIDDMPEEEAKFFGSDLSDLEKLIGTSFLIAITTKAVGSENKIKMSDLINDLKESTKKKKISESNITTLIRYYRRQGIPIMNASDNGETYVWKINSDTDWNWLVSRFEVRIAGLTTTISGLTLKKEFGERILRMIETLKESIKME